MWMLSLRALVFLVGEHLSEGLFDDSGSAV